MTADPASPPAPSRTVPDAPAGNWVDRLAPAAWRPYLRLVRFDRTIGAWLLLFPCWWGRRWRSSPSVGPIPIPGIWRCSSAGAFLMRGAGCTYNDIVDRDYDASVARTAARPIPSGQISGRRGADVLAVLCLAGLVILLQFNCSRLCSGRLALPSLPSTPS
jgi:4-hydroxybenzoate polyprenyltransferase